MMVSHDGSAFAEEMEKHCLAPSTLWGYSIWPFLYALILDLLPSPQLYEINPIIYKLPDLKYYLTAACMG